MAQYPLDWRSQIATSVFEAKPEEMFRVAGPSIAPFLLALGMTIASAALIFDMYWLILVGGVVSVIALAIWLGPDIGAVTKDTKTDELFAQEHGIPVNAGGSVAVIRSSMWLTVMTLGIALATFWFSYIHTWGDSPQWPPPGIALPELTFPGASTLLALITVVPMALAVRAVHRGQQRALVLALGVACLLGTSALAVYGISFVGLGFAATTNAYGSLFYTLGAFLLLTAFIGVGITAFVWYTARRGDYHSTRHVPVDNAALYWYGVAGMWSILFATMYLAPHL
jgi:cytochrome c oxidase subunit I+III